MKNSWKSWFLTAWYNIYDNTIVYYCTCSKKVVLVDLYILFFIYCDYNKTITQNTIFTPCCHKMTKITVCYESIIF